MGARGQADEGDGWNAHVLYLDDGWIGWYDDRVALEAWSHSKETPPDAFTPLLARVKEEKNAAAVAMFTIDLSARLLGVPSLGSLLTIAESPAGKGKGSTIVLYASADDATRASGAMKVAAADPTKSPKLRHVMSEMNPVAKGSTLVVDPGPFFLHPEVASEVMARMQTAAGSVP